MTFTPSRLSKLDSHFFSTDRWPPPVILRPRPPSHLVRSAPPPSPPPLRPRRHPRSAPSPSPTSLCPRPPSAPPLLPGHAPSTADVAVPTCPLGVVASAAASSSNRSSLPPPPRRRSLIRRASDCPHVSIRGEEAYSSSRAPAMNCCWCWCLLAAHAAAAASRGDLPPSLPLPPWHGRRRRYRRRVLPPAQARHLPGC
ncbi:hypothetical protein PVAP13_5KG584307 [Panicum virgatum]|uniref:Uncharacterized protein n=1 Tax=Panicum virgatum TaxID=38727 RepID=A0A8T0SZ39_PANVG|nr:hypothetical protein PVAP13_5KG584307 [Panicum virgatum]